MTILILAIVGLGIVAALIAIADKRRGGDDTPIVVAQTCSTCDGSTATKCEQECMMEASTKPIEYFDDEELDAYSGRPSDQYTDDEAQQFADIMYTMRQNEVAAWCRSLHLRGINMPDQIKDEAYILITN